MLKGLLKGNNGGNGSLSSAGLCISKEVQGKKGLTEKKIIDLMMADYSWEQVVYDIIASQGLDPWNLDLNMLSQTFLSYMKKIDELDFRIPAKYVIISSVILRMKSDSMSLLDIPSDDPGGVVEEDGFSPEFSNQLSLPKGFNMSLFNFHESRRPVKQIMVTDLICALRKVLSKQEIRQMKLAAAKDKIKINTDSIIDRINSVYEKINAMLGRVHQQEVPFSQVVDKWEKQSVIQHFLPLVYLENEKKVSCRQEEFFDEIFIKKQSNGHSVDKIEPENIKEIKNHPFSQTCRSQKKTKINKNKTNQAK